MIFLTQDVKGIRAPAVKGKFTPTEIIERLTAGSGLTATFNGNDTLVIKPKEERAGARGPNAEGTNSKGHLQLAQAQTPGQSACDEAKGADAAVKKGKLEKIEVTGSRIARVEAESSSPVITITQEEINRSGAATLSRLLARLPQASITQDESIISSFSGATTIRLRGMSPGTTLVLVNGRRVIASGSQSGSYFDLRNIPLSAIERVEILTDTASAIYGADALAGVVNVILKKGLSGFDLEARYGGATEGGLDEGRASIVGGSTGRFRTTWVADFFNSSTLVNAERSRTSDFDFRRFGGLDRRASTSNPGTIYALPGTGNLPGLNSTFAAVPIGSTGVGLRPSDFSATAGTRNLSSAMYASSNIPGARTVSGFLLAEYDMTRDLMLTGELLYSKSDVNIPSQYRALSGGAAGAFQVPANNPFNPFGRAVGVDYLLTGVGPSVQIAESSFSRGLLASRWAVSNAWTWDVAIWATRDRTFFQVENDADVARIRAALNQSDPNLALNVFQDGPGASLEVLRALIGPPTNVNNLRSSARQVESQIRGSVIALPAGDVDVVFGGEARRESMDSLSLGGASGSRTVRALYAEALVPIASKPSRIPLMEGLSFTLAARHDDYSDFGTSFNPQYGLKWTVNSIALVRASAGSAFKPPSINQLYRPTVTTPIAIVDPRRNNEAYAVPTLLGGNANLAPEEGESRNLGVVVSPERQLTISADWWQVKQTQRVTTTLLPSLLLANEATFQDRIQRAAPSAADVAAGRPGRVTAFGSFSGNLGSLDVSGIDVRASQSMNAASGVLTLSASATYVLRYDAQILPDQPIQDRRGIASTDAFSPKLKGTVSMFWQGARVGVGATARHTTSYRDYPGLPAPREVSSQTLVDLQGTYVVKRSDAAILPGVKEVRLALGVTNLFDREPPFANASFGYDNLQASILGRFAYLTIGVSF